MHLLRVPNVADTDRPRFLRAEALAIANKFLAFLPNTAIVHHLVLQAAADGEPPYYLYLRALACALLVRKVETPRFSTSSP